MKNTRKNCVVKSANPVGTSDVILLKEILEFCEKQAENSREVWAAGRVAQDWTYGETRSDERKETPCMLLYSELPESEKEYDRDAASETPKLIIKLGYSIM